MNLWESIRIALRGLRVNKMRSLLTILGIIVGVASVVCMVAIGAGARAQVTEKIRKLGTNLLFVSPGAADSGGARLGLGTRHTLTEDDAAAIRREIPGVLVAAPLVSRSVQVIAGNRNWSATVIGNNADYLVAREWPLSSGRLFTAGEIESGAKVAIIGHIIAEELFNGRAIPGDTLRIGNVPFSVIGVLESKGEAASGRTQDDVVIIPLATARSRVIGGQHEASRQALNYILVKASEDVSLDDVRAQITTLLRQRHRLRADAPADFTIRNPADALATQDASARTFGLLLASIASISLVVGGISIMNIMLVSVTERTREIGIRAAVGARPRDIRNQFLIEAVTLALIGGLIGAVVGSAASVLAAAYGGWPVLIEPSIILLACGFASVVGIAFGLYPAHRAAQLEPINALRFE